MLSEWTNLVNNDIKPNVKMSRNYYCIDCKISTRNPRVYLEHRRDFHQDAMTIHKCKLCVYASKHSQKLTRHMRTVHRDVVQSNVYPIGAAEHALGQPIAHASGMMPSMLIDKSARTTTCKLCGLYTPNKSILMQHIHTQHSNVKIYQCDQCEYSHYIRDRFNRHHRYHSMNYVQCKLCEFQTIYRWNLERHMRHHVDSISMGFRCKKCNFTASTKQSITAHELAHHSGLNVVQRQQQQQQQSNNESNVLRNVLESQSQTQTSSTMNSAMVNEPIKQNNSDCVGDDSNMNDDSASDFDASDFLEVVYDNVQTQKPKPSNSSTAGPTVMVTRENAMEWFQQPNASKTKFYYCANCRFRNEVDCGPSTDDELLTVRPDLSQSESPTVNSRYRCGYCHQASNWKHVIERHCRLVHNSSALIEKFSDEKQLFHYYKPMKRRTETCVGTATTAKRTVKIELNEIPARNTEPHHSTEIGDNGSNFSNTSN